MKKKQTDCFKNFHSIIHSLKNTFIKHLRNIDFLHELPLYNELSIKQVWKAFKRYARSYKIKIDSKDPLAQLEASKWSTKDLFKDFLDETKGFKYQIAVKVLLRKHKENGDIEFASVCFNSATKTEIDSKNSRNFLQNR